MAYEGIFELISKVPYYHLIASYIGEPFLRIFLFTIGLFIYGVITWKFYSTLARRDLFKVNITPYMSGWEKVGEALSFFFKYTIAFPFYTFFWFVVFSIFLILLSKSVTIDEIFFFSIVMISFTRAMAYYKEELAQSIAEVIPFTLLVIFLTDPTFFSIEIILTRWEEFLSSFPGILFYLLFTVCWEWFLRILYSLKLAFSSEEKKEE